ncbi:MAG TPA: VWA domain-containing protein [Candidatus Acidoferrales bacterium]|nr:VWA domain-containing protein [Candidatus Acidoferrales bacterium]
MKRQAEVVAGAVFLLATLGALAPLSLNSQSPRPVGPADALRPRVRVDIDLVLVNVTVTDPYNRLVTGLSKEHFEVEEDKARQQILYFSNEDVPLSLGVVFDLSGSMNRASKLERAAKAAVTFLQTANPEDEFFVVHFSDEPRLLTGFTHHVEDVQNSLVTIQAKGRTALLDALYLALDTMREASNPRKALLVISDGGDNHSRYSVRDVMSAVREADVQIYAIGIFDPVGARNEPEILWGPSLLKDIAETTGGRMFPVALHNLAQLPDVAEKISIELRNQYILGYLPSNKERDGTWRKIKVKLSPPKGLPPLTTYARHGYYAPTQ